MDSLGVYFIGNSVTENLKPVAFENIVDAADKKITWGWNVIYGQSLSYIWQHSGEGFIQPPFDGFENALTNYQWDAITLQPYQSPIGNSYGDLASVLNYLDLVKEMSPEIQVYIYQRWPRLPDGVEPLPETWDSLWVRTHDDQLASRYDSREFFENLTDSIRFNQTDTKKCLMIPVGEVMHRLNQEMKNGNIPGYTNIWDVYIDDIHMKGIGSYIIAATFYATLYQTDLSNTIVPGIYGFLNPTQRAIIQETIYETIIDYRDSEGQSWSGVEATGTHIANNIHLAEYSIVQSNNVMHISFSKPFDLGRKSIRILNTKGQIIYSRISAKGCTFKIPAKGIYIIQIEDLSGKVSFPIKKVLMN